VSILCTSTSEKKGIWWERSPGEEFPFKRNGEWLNSILKTVLKKKKKLVGKKSKLLSGSKIAITVQACQGAVFPLSRPPRRLVEKTVVMTNNVKTKKKSKRFTSASVTNLIKVG